MCLTVDRNCLNLARKQGEVECCPRTNGPKRRSGRKPGARVTNFVLAEFKVLARGSYVVILVCHDVILTDLNNMADYHEWLTLIGQI